MNHRAATLLAVSVAAAAWLALIRCSAPAWYHPAMGGAAAVVAAVLAVLLVKADPKLAAQAMADAREAQEALSGFLRHRGLSTGITR
jgi:hypothetical protein